MIKIKKAIIISALILALGIAFGNFIGTFDIDGPIKITTKHIYYANPIYIFFTNIFTCLLIFLGLGVISLPLTFIQGVNLGFSYSILYSFTQNNWIWLLALPHCLFEVPAIILSCSLGIVLLTLFKRKSHMSKMVCLSFFLRKHRSKMLSVVLLLLLAAFIECYLTGRIFLYYGR